MSRPGIQERRRAFTLIELLVAIAIISLLAAILFPVFGRARESARRASCLSSVRQIGIGYTMYLQDFDDRTPAINTFPMSTPPLWSHRLMPYVKSAELFSGCPSRGYSQIWNSDPTDSTTKDFISYAYNNMYNDPSSAADTIDGQKATPPSGNPNSATDVGINLAQFGSPADTVLFGDGVRQYMVYTTNKSTTAVDLAPPYSNSAYTNGSGTPTGLNINLPNIGRPGGTTNPNTSNLNQRYVGRHFGGANFCFADGHAKWMNMQTVSQTNSHGVMYYFTIEDDKNW